ncbi:MAG: type II secretion system secretin GspD [Candidatus Scalinduaceae bacterium]
MIRNSLLILFSFILTFETGCKIFTSKDKDSKKTVIVEEEKKPEVAKKRKWEWEITPQENKVEEEKVEAPKKEFSYPLEEVKTEAYTVGAPVGKKTDITFNFQNADIKEVLKVILGEILNINYILDKRVTGLITLRTKGKFYKEELLNIIQAMLNINGFALVRDKNVFQVLPIQEARSESRVVNIGDTAKTQSRDVITQIVPLKHVAPQTIIPTLRGLLSKAGFVIAPNDTHAIIISEKVTNMDRLLKIIRTFDVPFFAGKALKFYEVKHVDVASLAKDLDLVAQTLGAKTKGPKLDIAFIPFKDTSKILVATNSPEIFSSVDAWIANIDVHPEEKRLRMYVYKMQHEQAETTVPILTELFKEKITPTDKPGEVAEESMKIISDKNTNSIVIKALPIDYQSIKAIIETLDATPQQVLIEAIIAEVTLTDALKHGVEYFFRQKGRTNKGGIISLNPAGVTENSTSLLTGGTKFFTLNRDIDAIFNLIASETEVEVLSAPHILVRDAQTANIQVGASEPIRSGTTQTSAGATLDQIQYRDTGTILTVTPRIGENEMVTLDIRQEVSNAVAATETSIESPAFTTRITETSLVIKSNRTIYLGGIIDIKNELKIKKVPLLGDIPFVGNIFKSTDKTKSKTELMVLITPHVINTASEADMITREFKERLKQIAKMQKRVQ